MPGTEAIIELGGHISSFSKGDDSQPGINEMNK